MCASVVRVRDIPHPVCVNAVHSRAQGSAEQRIALSRRDV